MALSHRGDKDVQRKTYFPYFQSHPVVSLLVDGKGQGHQWLYSFAHFLAPFALQTGPLPHGASSLERDIKEYVCSLTPCDESSGWPSARYREKTEQKLSQV